MTHGRMSLLAILLGIGAMAGCGDSAELPTAPTPTRVIAVTGALDFGQVRVGERRDSTMTISNSGTATLTFTSISAVFGPPATSTDTTLSFSPSSGTVPAGGNVVVTIRFEPRNRGRTEGTVVVAGDQTSGTNTIAYQAVGLEPPFTVLGVVTNAVTGRPVDGVMARGVSSSATILGNATTDGNGYYSMVFDTNSQVVIEFRRSGYSFASTLIQPGADARRDISLVPSP